MTICSVSVDPRLFLVSFPGPSMVCTRMCVLHLGSGNETTLLPGSLLKTRAVESLVTVERKAVNF